MHEDPLALHPPRPEWGDARQNVVAHQLGLKATSGERSTRERYPDAARGAKAIAMRLDGQPRAHDVARGAEVEVAHGRYDAAWIDAKRTRCADVEVLILDAENHVDQRALVGHVVEAAARIPAAVVAHDAVSRAGRVANVGDGRAMGVLDMGR